MKMTPRNSVRNRILAYFNHDVNRTLSVAQARKFFKIKNVYARIFELRANGHDIRTTMTEGRDGVDRAVYTLVPARRRKSTSR